MARKPSPRCLRKGAVTYYAKSSFVRLRPRRQTARNPGKGKTRIWDVGAEDNAEAIYSVSIFGGIYPYRELFDAANVPGGHIQLPDGNRDYVRFVEVQDDDPGRSKLKSIFEQVLLNVPVYLVDSTQTANDELVSWTCSLSSVHLGETVS